MGRATRDGTREDEATHLNTIPITFECSRAAENIPCGGVAARRRVNAPDDATRGLVVHHRERLTSETAKRYGNQFLAFGTCWGMTHQDQNLDPHFSHSPERTYSLYAGQLGLIKPKHVTRPF